MEWMKPEGSKPMPRGSIITVMGVHFLCDGLGFGNALRISDEQRKQLLQADETQR